MSERRFMFPIAGQSLSQHPAEGLGVSPRSRRASVGNASRSPAPPALRARKSACGWPSAHARGRREARGAHSGQHPPGLGKLPTRHELARRIREGARQGSTVPTRPELVQRKE